MSADQIVIAVRPDSMRLFHKGQSHHSFIDILYKGQNVIDLEFDVTDIDVLLGSERNENNHANYCNPLSNLQAETHFRNGSIVKNIDLLIEGINKILGAHFSQLDANKNYASIIARTQLCAIYETGVTPQQIKFIDNQLSSESFAEFVSFSATEEYFNSLPNRDENTILLKSVDRDLYLFYRKTKIEVDNLPGVAINPEVEIIAREIFNHINRANSHLFFDLEKEIKILISEAKRVLNWHHPTVLQSIRLSSGRTFDYEVELAQCRRKANQMTQSGLIIKAVDSIIKESSVRHELASIYYTGENIDNEYFKGLLTNTYNKVTLLKEEYSLEALMESARKKLASINSMLTENRVKPTINETPPVSKHEKYQDVELSQSSPSKPPVVENTSLTSPPPSPKQVEITLSPAPLPPPPIGKTKPKTTTTTKKKVPPPPPAPPKGPMSAKKNVAASGKKKAPPPPPPAPPKGPTSAKKKVAASGKKKMAPPPPPPPKRK